MAVADVRGAEKEGADMPVYIALEHWSSKVDTFFLITANLNGAGRDIDLYDEIITPSNLPFGFKFHGVYLFSLS